MNNGQGQGLVFCGLGECQRLKEIAFLTVSFAVIILSGTWLSISLLGYEYAVMIDNIALVFGVASAAPLAYAAMVFLELNRR